MTARGLYWVLVTALRSVVERIGSTVLSQNEADRNELVQAGVVSTSRNRILGGAVWSV